MKEMQEALAAVLCAAKFVSQPEIYPVFLRWLKTQSVEAADLPEDSRDSLLLSVDLVDALYINLEAA